MKMAHARPSLGLRQILIAVLLSTACSYPYYVLPGNTASAPSEPASSSIVVACGEPSRRIFIPGNGHVRSVGPLSVRVLDDKGAPHPNSEDNHCTPGAPYCKLSIPDDATLEVSVGRLEVSGHDWGTLCFCKKKWLWDCTPDCTKAEARIDVRVSCPETRFARREAYGLRSAPLPAHLPVDLKCASKPGKDGMLDCAPAIVALEGGELRVYGAIQLAPDKSHVKSGEELGFWGAPSAVGKKVRANLCLHDACTNPAYFLPLSVCFGDTPQTATCPDDSTPLKKSPAAHDAAEGGASKAIRGDVRSGAPPAAGTSTTGGTAPSPPPSK